MLSAAGDAMLVCSATAAITELITFPTQTCRLRFVDVPPSCRGRAACVSWTCCVTVGDVLLACRGRAACVSGTCCVRVGDVLLACRGRAACLSGTCCLLVGDVLRAVGRYGKGAQSVSLIRFPCPNTCRERGFSSTDRLSVSLLGGVYFRHDKGGLSSTDRLVHVTWNALAHAFEPAAAAAAHCSSDATVTPLALFLTLLIFGSFHLPRSKAIKLLTSQSFRSIFLLHMAAAWLPQKARGAVMHCRWLMTSVAALLDDEVLPAKQSNDFEKL